MKTDPRQAQFLKGERLYLREVRPSDVGDRYHAWMNDPEVTRYLESRLVPQSREQLQEYVRDRLADKENLFLAIVLHDRDRHIGNIKLGPINWFHRLSEIGILIGEKDCWGCGFAAEAIGLLTDYAFRGLGLHKVTAGCYGSNPNSARAFQKAGFAVEGIRPLHFFFEGSYTDLVLLGRVNPE